MLTSTIFGIILALHLLTSFTTYVSALPITSKPIEGTAEHLAWQAWLMLPPEQKNLEKSRKVTPKSIFTLPFRECPPGHQLFENRCIPTVNIDQTALLTQQLLGFVVGDSVADNNYEFDYDDIAGDEIGDVMYEPAQNLSGDDSSKDMYHYDQLPSQDEPLKFNIFQQKFPTDYETESMPSDEPEEQTAKSTAAEVNATIPLAEAVNALTAKEPSPNAMQPKNSSIVDLQMESSNISTNIAQNASSNSNSNNNNSHRIVTPSAAFSISDIDAIALPAVATHTHTHTHNSNLENNEQNMHKFSLFKDDSSVQLVTSTLLAERENEHQKQPDLTQLLKADNLLPLSNITAKAAASSANNVGSSRKTTTTTASTSASTPSIFSDNEVSTLSTLFTSNIDTTTSVSDSNADEAVEATDMMLSDTEATLPTLLDDLLEKVEKVTMTGEPVHGHLKKEELPRSIISQNTTSAMTEPQEEKFTTTTEPDATTNFQVDETTVEEIHDAPTIALKELLELAQHPSSDIRENLGVVVKKSKVEPVELPPIEFIEADGDPSVMTTSTRTAPTSTLSTNSVVTKAAEVSTSSTLLPISSTPSSTNTDRFDNEQLDMSSTIYRNQPDERQRNTSPNDGQHDDSNFRNIETAKPTTQTSEIDIKQELRMINELVKGSNKHKQQFKGGIIKSETTSTAESGLSTVIKKSTKAAAVSKSDKISGSFIQQSSLNGEESRTSAAITTPISMTTTKETTTVATTTTKIEPTATIWSKIMPLFGFSTSFGETTVQKTTETTPSEEEISSTTTTSVIKAASSSNNIESSINNNRSNRNSKIIRINSLSTPSYSSSSSSSIRNNNKVIANELLASSTESSTTTTEMIDSSTTTRSSLSAENEPFWWLPIGWRLDRTTNNEPSLLLRLWSAFPDSEGTGKLNK